MNDLPLDQLKIYKPERTEPADFQYFWKNTLETARAFPLDVRFELVASGLNQLTIFDVTFNGYAGQPIKGWLIMPQQPKGKLPCVVEFTGYGTGRGIPCNWLPWASVGYAHFVMDNRGQGCDMLKGDTLDRLSDGSEPENTTFIVRGIHEPQTYYYQRLFTDAVRAVEAARSHPSVDPAHLAIDGASQGGGITLAVSGLAKDLDAIMPGVPFLCHYRRATQAAGLIYNNINLHVNEHENDIHSAYATLDYFDGVNFATYANAPALFSVGMLDETSVPSTVFAAYNYYAGEKEIRIWPCNHMECGDSRWTVEKVKFLAEIWKVNCQT